jgi:hypothetical protein
MKFFEAGERKRSEYKISRRERTSREREREREREKLNSNCVVM